MTKIPDNIQNCIDIYKTLTIKNKLVYLSVPITGGPKFVDWYNKTGKTIYKNSKEYEKLLLESVIKKNKQAAKDYAQSIYERVNEIVINPAEFDANFTQAEYLLLWTEFIKSFVSKIVFSPGWGLSEGCLSEFLVAKTHKVPRYDFNFNEINNIYAINTIEASKKHLDKLGMNSDIQTNILKLLKS